MKLIVDAGPLVALLNRRDLLHGWVQEVLNQHPPPLWTCEPVLAEAAYLSGRAADLMAMVTTGSVRIGLELEDQAEFLERLLRRYGQRMDLADACVIRMSELYPDCRVLTLDRKDFTVYRRNGREVIPLILPSE